MVPYKSLFSNLQLLLFTIYYLLTNKKLCIHVLDLGKVLLLPSFGGLPQWAVVGEFPSSTLVIFVVVVVVVVAAHLLLGCLTAGDTFPLGCAFDPSIVHYEVCAPSLNCNFNAK